MLLKELELDLPLTLDQFDLLAQIREILRLRLSSNVVPLRFAVTKSDRRRISCSISGLETESESIHTNGESIFEFSPCKIQTSDRFNVVLLIPTGIGAEIGGHSGDAGPAARLVAETCDTLILHPNVVNASDINEMSENSLYVEGSVITRLLMGTIGLAPRRSNRVLVVIDAHRDELFVNATVNAVSAARASYGLSCPKVIMLSPPLVMRAEFTSFGTAAGRISGLERIFAVLEEFIGTYDAVAMSSVISVPEEFHQAYFDAAGEMVNPWGGVEAMVTHSVSSRFNIPSAHSPMLESRRIANRDPGVVDPRMAAEAISLTFFSSVLKGLHKSPKIVTDASEFSKDGVISASDVSCLVIPDGCVGLPTLAAVKQGIPTIAVRENRNLMKNDLTTLPWQPGQLTVVENYWEAAGVLCAIRGGIAPDSVRRPLAPTFCIKKTFPSDWSRGSDAQGTKSHQADVDSPQRDLPLMTTSR